MHHELIVGRTIHLTEARSHGFNKKTVHEGRFFVNGCVSFANVLKLKKVRGFERRLLPSVAIAAALLWLLILA